MPSKNQSVKHYEKNTKNTAVFYSTSYNNTGGHHWCQLLCTNKPTRGWNPTVHSSKSKLPQLEVWAGWGVILLGFHTTPPSGETHQVELKWSHLTQTFFFTPMTQSSWGSNSLEEPLHVTTFILFFFLIKNINISGVQKYHRWFVTKSKRKYLARSGHGGFSTDGWYRQWMEDVSLLGGW